MFMKESEVDMIAARMPAMARPVTRSGVKPSRKSGAASSGLVSGAIFPCATRAGTVIPTPNQISRQRICEPPRVSGSQRRWRGSRSMKNLWSMCGWPSTPIPKTK